MRAAALLVIATLAWAAPFSLTSASFTSRTTDPANTFTNLVVTSATVSGAASLSAGEVRVTWSASPTAATQTTLRYRVLRRPSGGSFAEIASGLSVLEHADLPPSDGTYDYVVQAYVSTFGRDSATGTGLSDRTAPATSIACDGVACSSSWYGAAVIVAISATDAGVGTASVTRSLDGDGEVTTSGGSVTFTVSTSGTHTVAYYATDALGHVAATRTTTVPVDVTAPAAATGLSASKGSGSGTIDLSWTAGTDAHSGVAGYDVYVIQRTLVETTCPTTGYTLHTSVGAVTSTTVSELAPLTYYCLLLRTRDVAGNASGDSAAVRQLAG